MEGHVYIAKDMMEKKKPTRKPQKQKLWPVNMRLTGWREHYSIMPALCLSAQTHTRQRSDEDLIFRKRKLRLRNSVTCPKLCPKHVWNSKLLLMSISFLLPVSVQNRYVDLVFFFFFFGPDAKLKLLIKCFSIHQGGYQDSIKIYLGFI